MHKSILIFFSFWMIVTNSCALKKSVHNLVSGVEIENYYQHSEKSLPRFSFNNTLSSCKIGFKNVIETISDNFSYLLKVLKNAPFLLFSLYGAFLIALIHISFRFKRSFILTIRSRFKEPLYIQFHRLQYYA